MVPTLENPNNLDYPAAAEQIIKTMFVHYRRVVIRREFGGGHSGGRVLEIQPIKADGTPELPVVVKLATLSLIQKEWQAYQQHIRRRLPYTAEGDAEPILLPDLGWGGLRYTMMGGATFEMVSLRDYCARADVTVKDIQRVLERLLKIMHNIWSYNEVNLQFQLHASYDRLLPVNLLIQHQPLGSAGQPYLITPDALPVAPFQVGDRVRVSGFAISKINPATQTITLNRSPLLSNTPAYSLRCRSPLIEQLVTYQANQIFEPFEGEVIETRASRLHAEIHHALGENWDVTAQMVSLSDQINLPNPLFALDSILNGTQRVKIASIHGDFHLENILIEPETGMVSLIDFADSRQDHILHDFLRLETEVITRLMPEILHLHQLPLTPTLASFYQQLHAAAFQTIPEHFVLLHPALRKPLAMLLTIRQAARQYFFDEHDPVEYYQGLVLYMLGALKFKNLDQAPEHPLSKQAAFWAAVLAYHFLTSTATFEVADLPQPYLSLTLDELYEVLEEKPAAPFQVLHDVPQFVGRERDLAQVRQLLTQANGQRVFCLTGMGGVGKTSLAVRLAHTLRDEFADGVLWANVAASEPLAILDSWARAYDYDFSSLPDLESRAAALRNALADKKALLVLDNVWSADQVRPLFPGGSHCVVLLTSRDLDLAAALGGHEYRLSVLTAEESRQLLIEIVGSERVLAEETFADEICRILGHLPLAVKIAARRLASRRRWRLADLAERLRDEKQRLAELKLGDREVRASFAVSWDTLNDPLRRIFTLVGVFEGRLFTIPALAAVAQLEVRAAADRIEALVALSLVAEEGEQYYRQHPLLADFAREHLGEDATAFERMAGYYLDYAREHQRHYLELEEESDNLLAGMRIAYQQKLWQLVIDYPNTLAEAWFARARFSDLRQGYQWACEGAEALQDRMTLVAGLCQWGRACIEQGDYAEAEAHLSTSLQLCQELDYLRGIADAQYFLGRIAIEKANFDEAQLLLTESRRIREQLDDQLGVAGILYIQADIPYYAGNYEEAERLGKQALQIQEAVCDNHGCIRSLGLLADIAIKQDQPDLGAQYCRQALALCEEIEEQSELAIILYILSEALRLQGNLGVARDQAERSLVLLTRMGDRKNQARALWRLSLIDADLKDYNLALEEGLQSRNILRKLEDPWPIIYTLLHLGDIHRILDQPDQAREIWLEALNLAEALEHPLTESLRERLNSASA